MKFLQRILLYRSSTSQLPAFHQTPSPVYRLPWTVYRVPSAVLLLCLFSACARQGAPTGGSKDTTPPGLDSLASTPNFSTRFDKKRIELKFDEWVVLSEASSQVVVSPPLAKRPEVVLKGRTVVLNMDKAEVLRPNTTYTINFGTAVKDLHEGNPAKDLRFVFSTGDFIDSLSFRGQVRDAFTGEPVENLSVMLYENFADSAVLRDRPYYFSRTDKTGQYEFKNLRSGTFRVVVMEDPDQNLKWNGDSERIGFRDSALQVTDKLRGIPNLNLFKNTPKFRIIGQNTSRYGLLRLGYTTPIDSFELQTIVPTELKSWLEKTPDSLLFWYDLPQVDTSWSLIFKHPEQLSSALDTGKMAGPRADTIQIRKFSRAEFLKNHRIGFADLVQAAAPVGGRGKSAGPVAPVKAQAVKTVIQTPAEPAVVPFNFPIAAFDTAFWSLSPDSTRLVDFTIRSDSSSPRRLLMQVNWKQGANYNLILYPGAITDVWGATNTDTLRRSFNVLSEKQLGTLSLNLEKLNPGTAYVLQLLNNNAIDQERVFTAQAETQKLLFKYLQVATYSVRLIEDSNRNGRWDTGDFTAKRQPEKVFGKKLDALRANWELEASFSAEAAEEKKRKQ